MRLIQWNCQGAFRSKYTNILSCSPDILIVSECENQEKLKFGQVFPEPKDFYWYGDSKNKGIGIFSFSDYKLELLNTFNPVFRYILPFKVTGPDRSFTLFAIWAMNNKENREARYIGQVWLALNYYSSLLDDKSVLIGDFNSNKIWDYKDRIGNHSDVVDLLNEKRIISLSHDQNKIEQGKENEPTLYMYRKKEKPYHIDYCFASDSFIKNGYRFQVGTYENWIEFSDHTPIIIDIE